MGLSMPQDVNKINLPQLSYLHLGNNSGSVPNSLGHKHFPIVVDLYLNSNTMETLPTNLHTLKSTLSFLGVANCGLKDLEGLDRFQGLVYLDARNNNISKLSTEVKNMIKSDGFESYFSGNPICLTDDLTCNGLCTDFCWSEKGFNDGYCDETCDSSQCNYDGGDCRHV
jgi:Leucine-rich repeat (LRR) protein